MTNYDQLVKRLRDGCDSEFDGECSLSSDDARLAASSIEDLQRQIAAAFAMSKCECGADEACRNLVAKDDRISELERQIADATQKAEADAQWRGNACDLLQTQIQKLQRQLAEKDDALKAAVEAHKRIIERSHNDPLGISKVIDMRNISAAILAKKEKAE